MVLKEYRSKRNFQTTPEPLISKKSKAKELIFVVQKHEATTLHYDFRLELKGVLKSWVLPKGPSLNPKDKRLAIMVEDHPYDYKDFEGTIPKGNYGAGTVMVWDRGIYYPLDKNYQLIDEKAMIKELKKGELTFALKGEKLLGIFHLIKLKGSLENHWLFIKVNDSFVTTKEVIKQENSVLTQRSMQQISANTGNPNIESGERGFLKNLPVSKMPKNIQPMLACLAEQPFDHQEWLFEIKWDGYRAIAEIEEEQINLYSRRQQNFNQLFSVILEALKKLHIHAIFDGEITILDEQGKSKFQALQNYQQTGEGELCYCIFDLLYYQGHDLRNTPLIQRKQLLQAILSKNKHPSLHFSDHLLMKGKELFKEAKRKGIEGIIAKEINSHYQSKRSRDWLKIKTHQRQEAIICGFTEPRGSRRYFGALVLGIYEDKILRYVGHVGGGFTEDSLRTVKELLDPLVTKKCPFSDPPITNTSATWLKPKLVCEISFSEWTKDNHMRQPIYLGMRPDKNPKEVKKELPLSSSIEKEGSHGFKKRHK